MTCPHLVLASVLFIAPCTWLSGLNGEAGRIQVNEGHTKVIILQKRIWRLAQSSLTPGVPFTVGGFRGEGALVNRKLPTDVNRLLLQQLFAAPNLFPPLNRFLCLFSCQSNICFSVTFVFDMRLFQNNIQNTVLHYHFLN